MREDIGILLIFFNRAEIVSRVLKRILEAKPQKLFLAQDGARKGNHTDIEKVEICRETVENLVRTIDWNCEIFREYSVQNMSCDNREFSAISWAFRKVDKLIILEDDCLCAKSFFPFMEELLIRYEFDERMQMVCGLERFGYNSFCDSSYYFTQAANGCGWGTWRRIWNEVEKNIRDFTFLNKKNTRDQINKYVGKTCLSSYKNFIDISDDNYEANKKSGIVTSWEYAISTSMILSSRLAIVSAVNQVENIGISPDATHSGDDIRVMPYRTRRIFENKAIELEFPLKHPEYVLRDIYYEEKYEKTFVPGFWGKMRDYIEKAYLLIKYGKGNHILLFVKKRIQKWYVR